jgi:hypothetical protein
VAKPREARGWFVYSVAVGVAFLTLAFRLYYAAGATSPFLVLDFIDVPFVIAVLAGALAVVGLLQALWHSFVTPNGPVLFVASLLMFIVGLLHFYALPNHLASRDVFLLQFVAAFVVFVYVPTLSWGSKPFVGIGIVGAGALLAASLYGPITQSVSFTDILLLATLAAEGLLVLTLLRLGQVTFMPKSVATA